MLGFTMKEFGALDEMHHVSGQACLRSVVLIVLLWDILIVVAEGMQSLLLHLLFCWGLLPLRVHWSKREFAPDEFTKVWVLFDVSP